MFVFKLNLVCLGPFYSAAISRPLPEINLFRYRLIIFFLSFFFFFLFFFLSFFRTRLGSRLACDVVQLGERNLANPASV